MATSAKRHASMKSKALGALIREELMADPKKQKALLRDGGSVVFGVLGDVLNAWLAGKTKMVAVSRTPVKGDAAATYRACGRRGFSIADLKDGAGTDRLLKELNRKVADLSYLLLRGLVAPAPADYAPPAAKTAAALLDVPALLRRYPDLSHDLPILADMRPYDPGTVRCPAAIAAVDAGVLILDYVRSSK